MVSKRDKAIGVLQGFGDICDGDSVTLYEEDLKGFDSAIIELAKLDEIEKIIRTDCDRPDAAVIKIKEVLSREEND